MILRHPVSVYTIDIRNTEDTIAVQTCVSFILYLIWLLITVDVSGFMLYINDNNKITARSSAG